MTAAVILLSTAVVFLALVLWGVIVAQQKSQAAWQAERCQLINRVVARHAGEVLALDHSAEPKQQRERVAPVLIEGLA